MSNKKKVMLNYEKQIQHLDQKGITFTKKDVSKEIYLTKYFCEENNYFRLRAYRENFEKDSVSGKYQKLDFSYLDDLASIDRQIRKIIISMTLDIEYHSRLYLLDLLMNKYENEYGNKIIEEFYLENPTEKEQCNDEIDRNSKSLYVSKLCEKHQTLREEKNDEKRQGNNLYNSEKKRKFDYDFPIWAFLEVISFGKLIKLYDFCAKKIFEEDQESREYNEYKLISSLLKTVKNARNAAAHNNCFINNLNYCHNKSDVFIHKVVRRYLQKIGIKYEEKKEKKKILRNNGIAQIFTCLYAHRKIVKSNSVHKDTCNELQNLKERLFKNLDYEFNTVIRDQFENIKKVIDRFLSEEI